MTISRTKGRKPYSSQKVGHRERMRDHAVIVYGLLKDNRRISLDRIAQELGTSKLTARRWVNSFSCVLPIRMEEGVVIVEQPGK